MNHSAGVYASYGGSLCSNHMVSCGIMSHRSHVVSYDIMPYSNHIVSCGIMSHRSHVVSYDTLSIVQGSMHDMEVVYASHGGGLCILWRGSMHHMDHINPTHGSVI